MFKGPVGGAGNNAARMAHMEAERRQQQQRQQQANTLARRKLANQHPPHLQIHPHPQPLHNHPAQHPVNNTGPPRNFHNNPQNGRILQQPENQAALRPSNAQNVQVTNVKHSHQAHPGLDQHVGEVNHAQQHLPPHPPNVKGGNAPQGSASDQADNIHLHHEHLPNPDQNRKIPQHHAPMVPETASQQASHIEHPSVQHPVNHNRPLRRKFTPPPGALKPKDRKRSYSDPGKKRPDLRPLNAEPAAVNGKLKGQTKIPDWAAEGVKAAGTGWVTDGLNGIMKWGVNEVKDQMNPKAPTGEGHQEHLQAVTESQSVAIYPKPEVAPESTTSSRPISHSDDASSFTRYTGSLHAGSPNVSTGDQLVFPRHVSASPKVTVSWMREGVLNSKTYLMFTSWNLNTSHSVLTFVDETTVAIDQNGLQAPFTKIYPNPDHEKNTEYILMDGKWQYGRIGEHGERFIVHQRHRFPDLFNTSFIGSMWPGTSRVPASPLTFFEHS